MLLFWSSLGGGFEQVFGQLEALGFAEGAPELGVQLDRVFDDQLSGALGHARRGRVAQREQRQGLAWALARYVFVSCKHCEVGYTYTYL